MWKECTATGSTQAKPGIPGIDNEKVVFATDILDGKLLPGRNVLILGGGMTGVETADFLAQHNRSVTVLEMRSDIALDEEMIPRAFLMPRLAEAGVQKIVNARVTEIYSDGVKYIQNDNEYEVRGFDNIILALGVRPYNPLEKELEGLVDQVIAAMHFFRESLLLSLWLKYMWQFPGFAPAILHSCEAESPSAGVICS